MYIVLGGLTYVPGILNKACTLYSVQCTAWSNYMSETAREKHTLLKLVNNNKHGHK